MSGSPLSLSAMTSQGLFLVQSKSPMFALRRFRSKRKGILMSDKIDTTHALERQVEKILSQSSGDRRQVIIRMASPVDDKKTLITLASDALKQRNMALSARECLPPPKGPVPDTVRRQYQTQFRQVSDPKKSFTGQVDRKHLE